MHFHELARAKINLTLNVLGRRADGYHDIESLVTFADIGDRITLDLGTGPKVSASGPFAGAIEGENLLETTLRLVHEGYPEVRLGAVALEKNLPVAAGLGGGSADAAALLRALRHANKERSASIDWGALARRLGADVAVCLAGVPALMHGIGDIVDPLDETLRPPVLAAVLINPRVPLPTAEVFSALALPASARTASGRPPAPPDVKDAAALVDYMRARGNDLESAAMSLRPIIADVKAALVRQSGNRIAAMTGSGATCFGIFTDDAAASAAAGALQRAHPQWWVAGTRLG